MPLIGLVLVLLWAVGDVAQGAEQIESSVEHEIGRFVLHSEVLVGLPPAEVRAILTRYENLPRVNGGIRKVRILERDESGEVRMQVFAGVCILMFCLNYQWVQDVKTLPDSDVLAVIDAEVSDFREGRARWRFLPQDGCTRLVFDADVRPDFWFPPLLGPWLIKRKLAEEALQTAQGVERIAAEERGLKPTPASACTATAG